MRTLQNSKRWLKTPKYIKKTQKLDEMVKNTKYIYNYFWEEMIKNISLIKKMEQKN